MSGKVAGDPISALQFIDPGVAVDGDTMPEIDRYDGRRHNRRNPKKGGETVAARARAKNVRMPTIPAFNATEGE